MKINITGKNIEVTEAIKNAVNEELASLDKYFKSKELEANVLVRTYNVGQKIEITISMDKDHTLRQEVVANDLYDAIKMAVSKMERQVRDFKGRILDHNHKKELINMFFDVKQSEEPKKIIKRKTLDNKLMTEDEAILQFELIGHDFYIFDDANTEITKVLYKRKDNEYGIIELN